jgi:hypothetical protein
VNVGKEGNTGLLGLVRRGVNVEGVGKEGQYPGIPHRVGEPECDV